MFGKTKARTLLWHQSSNCVCFVRKLISGILPKPLIKYKAELKGIHNTAYENKSEVFSMTFDENFFRDRVKK